jgi:hypothetical protein
VVAVDQPPSRDVGTERLPPCVSALRRVRDPGILPADRRKASDDVIGRAEVQDGLRLTIYD